MLPPPNPFYLARNTASHYEGDHLEFATSPKRSLSIPEAIQLCAHLAVLINDDRSLSKQIDALRGQKPAPAQTAKAVKPAKLKQAKRSKSKQTKRSKHGNRKAKPVKSVKLKRKPVKPAKAKAVKPVKAKHGKTASRK